MTISFKETWRHSYNKKYRKYISEIKVKSLVIYWFVGIFMIIVGQLSRYTKGSPLFSWVEMLAYSIIMIPILSLIAYLNVLCSRRISIKSNRVAIWDVGYQPILIKNNDIVSINIHRWKKAIRLNIMIKNAVIGLTGFNNDENEMNISKIKTYFDDLKTMNLTNR